MSQEIKDAVTSILEHAGVTFSAIYRGQRKRDEWDCDEWSCSFTKGDGREAHEEFEYFTGLGLRAEATKQQRQQAKQQRQQARLPGLTEKDITQRTIYGRRYLAEVEKLRKPLAPSATDVLYSLVRDASTCEQAFSDWCSDFGYDSDSRKAYAIYEACQESLVRLRRVLGRETIRALEAALEDY